MILLMMMTLLMLVTLFNMMMSQTNFKAVYYFISLPV